MADSRKDSKTAPIVVGTTTTAATASASTPSDPGAELKLFFMDVVHQFLNELPGDAKDLTKEQAKNRERVRGQLTEYFKLFTRKNLTFHPADLIEFTQLIASLEKEISNPLILKNKGPILHLLGLAYECGIGVKEDEVKAKEYFNQAIKINYPLSLVELGMMGNPKHAIDLYTQAANAGCAYAYYSLGGLYRIGIKVDRDYKKAREYYQKAGELGDSSGWNNLGYMHNNSEGGPKDQKTANEFYQKAADLNSLSGLYSVHNLKAHEKAAKVGVNQGLQSMIDSLSPNNFHYKDNLEVVPSALVKVGVYVLSRGNIDVAKKCFAALGIDSTSYLSNDEKLEVIKFNWEQDKRFTLSGDLFSLAKTNHEGALTLLSTMASDLTKIPTKELKHLCLFALKKLKASDGFPEFIETLKKIHADVSLKPTDQQSGPGLFDTSSAAASTVIPSTGLRKRHPKK